jgi:glycyl-tRNA synthetase beta subunit
MRHKNHEDFAEDHKEIVKRAHNIAKDIKTIVKRNLIPSIFPGNAHKNLINYSKKLNTSANTLQSLK